MLELVDLKANKHVELLIIRLGNLDSSKIYCLHMEESAIEETHT